MRMKLDQLPPRLRAQAQAQLDRGTRRAPPPEQPRGMRPKKRGAPNKTEQRFNVDFLGGRGMYEAVSFRLPGGSRYTPDWVTFDAAGRMTVYEVKGAYRFPSESRAVVAFHEARTAFPAIRFEWWADSKTGWLQKHKRKEAAWPQKQQSR